MNQEEREKSLDKQIATISKSTRASFGVAVPLHDVIRQKYHWYYKWHLNPISSKVHIMLLLLYLVLVSFFSYTVFVKPEKVTLAAGNTCTTNGTGYMEDPNIWDDCGGDAPGSGDSVIIAHAVESDSHIDLGAGDITINSGGTLTTNNNNYTFNDMTINTGGTLVAGSSILTCSGSWDHSAGTFTSGTSTIVMTGTGTFNTGGNTKPVKNLQITGAGETVTLSARTSLGTGGILTVGSSSGAKVTIAGGQTIDLQSAATPPIVFVGTYNAASGGGYNIDATTVNYFLNGDHGIASGTYGGLYIRGQGSANRTATLLGDLTTTGLLEVHHTGSYTTTLDTDAVNSYDITVGGFFYLASTTNSRYAVIKCNGSILDFKNDVVIRASDASGETKFDANSATIYARRDWSNSDVFDADTSSVHFIYTASVNRTITTNNSAFYDVEFDHDGTPASYAYIISGNLDVNHNLTLTDGKLDLSTNNPTVTVGGNFNLAADGLWTKSTNGLNFDGTTTFTDSTGTPQNLGAVVMSGTSVTLASSMTLDTLNISAGTLDTSGNNITVAGNWTNNGTFTAGSGTVTFNGTAIGKTITSGLSEFNNVVVNGAGGEWTLQDEIKATSIDIASGSLRTSNQNLEASVTISGGELHGGGGEMTLYGLAITDANSIFSASMNTRVEGIYSRVDTVTPVDWLSNNSQLFIYATTQTLPADTYYYLEIVDSTVSLSAGTTTVNNNLHVTIDLIGTSSLAVGSNTLTVLGSVNISQPGNTLSATTGTINVGGDWTNGGTFTCGESTVNFTKASDMQTLNAGGTGVGYQFYHFNHTGAGNLNVINNAFEVNGDFTNTDGSMNAGGDPRYYGNWTNSGDAIYRTEGGSSSYLGATLLTNTSTGSVYNDGPETVNGTVTLGSDWESLGFGGTGTLNLGENHNLTITNSGEVMLPDHFNGGTGTSTTIFNVINEANPVTFKAAGAVYNNLTLSGDAFYSPDGDLTAANSSGILGDFTIDINGSLYGESHLIEIAGSFINNGANCHDILVNLTGNNTGKTITTNMCGILDFQISGAGEWTMQDELDAASATVSAGNLIVGNNLLLITGNLTIDGGKITGSNQEFSDVTADGELTISDGEFIASTTTNITGEYLHSGGTVDWTTNSSTLTWANLTGDTIYVIPPDEYNNLTLSYTSASFFNFFNGETKIRGDLNTNGMIDTYQGTINFNRPDGIQTISGIGVYNINHSGAGTLKILSEINSTNDITNLSGPFDANGQNIMFIGDWNFADGTFSAGETPGDQYVWYNGSGTHIFSGSNTFNNLSFTASSEASEIDFVSGSIQTVNGTFNLVGQETSPLTLGRSGGAGEDQWNLVLAGNYTIGAGDDYITPSNSNVTGGTINAISTNTVDGGNNDGWNFIAPPTAPIIGSPVAASATAIEWHFTDTSSDELGFKVYDSGDNLVATCATPNLTYCTETGLSVNTQYSGRYVVAYNIAGNSPHSGTADAIYTLANTPLAPTVDGATNTSLTVKIGVNENPASTKFAIYNQTLAKYVQADGSSGDSAVWQNYAAWGGAAGIANTGLSASTIYAYTVKARNGDNAETAMSPSGSGTTSGSGPGPTPTLSPTISPTLTPTITPTTPPTDEPTPTANVSPTTSNLLAPSNLRALNLGAITLTLVWDNSSSNTGVSGYEIYNFDTKIKVGTTTSQTFDFIGLTPNTTYKFYVRAFDSNNNYSPNSSILTITTSESTTPEEEEIASRGGVVSFLVLANAPNEAQINKPLSAKIKITAADVGGKIVQNYTKSVFFTTSDKLAELTFNEANPYTFSATDKGVHEFNNDDFVFNSVGNQTLSVSDNSTTSTVSIKVISGTASILERSSTYVRSFLGNTNNLAVVNIIILVLIAGILVLPTLVKFFSNIGILLPQLTLGFTNLFQMFGWRKKRKTWGVVFNSQTGQPIPYALVKLIDKHNKLYEVSVTDSQGKYGFQPPHGTYRIKAERVDFKFPSTNTSSSFYERIYTGTEVKISDSRQDMTFNIALDPYAQSTLATNFWLWLVILNQSLQKIRLPLLVFGTIFALTMAIINTDLFYFLLTTLCLLFIVLQIIDPRKARASGEISDVYDHIISRAIVKIYHKDDNKLIDTGVSNSKGQFSFKVKPGIYYVVATKLGFVNFKSHLIYLQKHQKKQAITAVSIKLKKLA